MCPSCQESLLSPELFTRTLSTGIEVTSFYPYHDISSLIQTKHTFIGHEIFKIVAANSFQTLSKTYQGEKLYVIPIDDHVRNGYSHTALLAQATKSTYLTPLFGTLHAQNQETYSGKSLDFRRNNPRNFTYNGETLQDVILVDDVVTTGSTLNEAITVLHHHGVRVFHTFVLADASREG